MPSSISPPRRQASMADTSIWMPSPIKSNANRAIRLLSWKKPTPARFPTPTPALPKSAATPTPSLPYRRQEAKAKQSNLPQSWQARHSRRPTKPTCRKKTKPRFSRSSMPIKTTTNGDIAATPVLFHTSAAAKPTTTPQRRASAWKPEKPIASPSLPA